VRDAWDGDNLRFTFRRAIDRRLMEQWPELLKIARSIRFTDEKDAIV
jgi:hypothetical protein